MLKTYFLWYTCYFNPKTHEWDGACVKGKGDKDKWLPQRKVLKIFKKSIHEYEINGQGGVTNKKLYMCYVRFWAASDLKSDVRLVAKLPRTSDL